VQRRKSPSAKTIFIFAFVLREELHRILS